MSRLAWDVVRDENERLREQNAALVDHVTRMDRVEHGKPEEKPRRKETKLEPMPEDLEALIDGFHSEAVRKDLKQQAYIDYRRHGDWNRVRKKVADALTS